MINDWKSVIQDNKVKNKIPYRNLKDIDDVADSAKLNSNKNGRYNNNNNNNSSSNNNNNNQSNYSPQRSSNQQTPKRRVRSQISMHPNPNKLTIKQVKSSLPLKNRNSQANLSTSIDGNGNNNNLLDSYSTSSLKSAKQYSSGGNPPKHIIQRSQPAVNSLLKVKNKFSAERKYY